MFSYLFLPAITCNIFKSHCNLAIWLQYLYNKSDQLQFFTVGVSRLETRTVKKGVENDESMTVAGEDITKFYGKLTSHNSSSYNVAYCCEVAPLESCSQRYCLLKVC